MAGKETETAGQLKWEFIEEVSEGEEEGILIEENPERSEPRKKPRSEKEYHDLRNRLRRIEGQVRGIQGMLERDAYCTDILTQVSAVTAALNSFSKLLLTEHVYTCVSDSIREGNDEALEELVRLMHKLMK